MQEWETTPNRVQVLCTMDDASYFLVIRLGPKTSECEKNVTVVSSVTGCDVTNCATTLHGFNKHASSRREAVSDSRGVPRCTEKNSQNLRLLTCVDRSTRPIHHTFCLQLVLSLVSVVPATRRTRLAQLCPHTEHRSQSVESIVHVPAHSFRCRSGSHQSQPMTSSAVSEIPNLE